MRKLQQPLRASLAATVASALVLGAAVDASAQRGTSQRSVRVGQPAGVQRPSTEVLLSTGQGQMINLPADVTTVWTSNPGVADVFVNSSRQINLFGKEFGEATVFATSASGAVIYAANVRVSQNITSIDRMMKLAMPEADVKVTTVGQLAVLTGTVASPGESQEAQRLATTLLNPGVDLSGPNALLKIAVINRLKTATPLQVNLQVRIAEVSRSFVKNIGVNLASRDGTNGFQFSVGSGRQPGSYTAADLAKYPTARIPLPGGGYIDGPYDPSSGQFINPNSTSGANISRGAEQTTLGLAGKLFGLDLLAAIDLGETVGQVTTLASPNLTALSGETASFLAGGEIPIPISQGLGAVSVEYKQYGVSLAYTPTVLADGRISLRVRPEVSQLSAAGAVTISGVTIPALTTRRAETTVELGSGQSFMIAGLMSNSHDNMISKAPGIGDLPILGSLFRSNGFKRNETELVVVVTPYLVKPVNANEIVLPTDGYKAPTDLERVFLGTIASGTKPGEPARPKPSMATPSAPPPSSGAVAPQQPAPTAPVREQPSATAAPAPAAPAVKKDKANAAAMPGFSFK